MNREALEMLLIDRALGELSPEAEDLLEAHLGREPGWRAEAERIEETLRVAKQALEAPAKPALQAFERERPAVAPSRPAASRWHLPVWAYGMAACFSAGLSLGWLATRAAPQPWLAELKPNAHAVAPAAPSQSTFWSRQHWHPTTPPGTLGRRTDVIWKSPVRKPGIKTSL